MSKTLSEQLRGGDLRSIGNSNLIIKQINDQASFNKLIQCLLQTDRIVVMRAADAVEKITSRKPDYLTPHKQLLIALMLKATNKELKWHLAQLITRLPLNKKEISRIWKILSEWTLDKKESKIVRANSLTALHYFTQQDNTMNDKFSAIIRGIEKENIPSLKARTRNLLKSKI